MKTTKKWSKMLLAGMAAMVLAFGLIVMGCETLGDFASGYNSGYSGGSNNSESERQYTVMLHVSNNTSGYDTTLYVYATSKSQAGEKAKQEFLASHPGYNVTISWVN